MAAFVTAERARVYAGLSAGVVLAGYLVSITLGPIRSGSFTDMSGTLIGADFAAFHWAGHSALHGHGDALYDLDREAEFLDALRAPAPSDGEVDAFLSPPYWALFFVPFGAVSYPLALVLFWALSLFALWLATSALGAELPRLERLGPVRKRMALAVAYFPVLFSLLNGQTSLLFLAALTMFFVLLRRREDFLAGLVLGLLAVKPQLALGPVLVLLAAWRGRALIGATLAASLWLALGIVVLPHAMAEYATVAPELFEFVRQEGYETWGQLSLAGFVTLLVDPLAHDAATWLSHAATIAGAIACLVLVRRVLVRGGWAPGSTRWDLGMAAALSLGLVVSPHLFLYDAALLALPLAITYASIEPRGDALLDGGPVLVAAAALVALSFVGPYLTLAVQLGLDALELPRVALQLTTLAVLLWSLRLAERARASAAPSET